MAVPPSWMVLLLLYSSYSNNASTTSFSLSLLLPMNSTLYAIPLTPAPLDPHQRLPEGVWCHSPHLAGLAIPECQHSLPVKRGLYRLDFGWGATMGARPGGGLLLVIQ